jgi:hypothetical protein
MGYRSVTFVRLLRLCLMAALLALLVLFAGRFFRALSGLDLTGVSFSLDRTWRVEWGTEHGFWAMPAAVPPKSCVFVPTYRRWGIGPLGIAQSLR